MMKDLAYKPALTLAKSLNIRTLSDIEFNEKGEEIETIKLGPNN